MKSLIDRGIAYIAYHGWLNGIPDELYLKILYKALMGKKLDLEHPHTFNEKLQWLKLHDRNPKYTMMVDKYEAKKYVADIIGEEYIIPTLGVWNRFDDIDFDSLPDQFVLKCTHDSGGLIICKDKSKLDYYVAKRKIEKSLKNNYYYSGREWPYKNIVPRVIAEPYIEDEFGELRDYKFSCFNGTADNVMVCMDRASGEAKFYFFDKDWNLLKLNKRGQTVMPGFTVEKPKNLEKMFEIATILSENLPYARVDLYNINGKIYFGEITFYPDSGFDRNLLKETDILFGNKINLSVVN